MSGTYQMICTRRVWSARKPVAQSAVKWNAASVRLLPCTKEK
jgi:hypothetical protein